MLDHATHLSDQPAPLAGTHRSFWSEHSCNTTHETSPSKPLDASRTALAQGPSFLSGRFLFCDQSRSRRITFSATPRMRQGRTSTIDTERTKTPHKPDIRQSMRARPLPRSAALAGRDHWLEMSRARLVSCCATVRRSGSDKLAIRPVPAQRQVQCKSCEPEWRDWSRTDSCPCLCR